MNGLGPVNRRSAVFLSHRKVDVVDMERSILSMYGTSWRWGCGKGGADESIASRQQLDKLCISCYLQNNALPFGGLYVLFTGDLHQLRCIRDKSLYIDCRDEYITAGCELSPLQKNYIAG